MSDRQKWYTQAFFAFVVPVIIAIYGYGQLTTRLENIEKKVKHYDDMRIEFAAAKASNLNLEKSVDRLTYQLDRVSERLEIALRESSR